MWPHPAGLDNGGMLLLTLGFLFLVGLVADVVGRLTPLPRVTLLLLSGVLIGPSGFDVLPPDVVDSWFPTLTHLALAMVGFLMGQKLTVASLRDRGATVLSLALGKVLLAALAVFAALIAMGAPYPLALVLAGIASATAPAATFDVLHESGATGAFSDTLVGIVALDDALALVGFSVLLALATDGLAGGLVNGIAFAGLMEAGASVVLGLLLGVPMAYLTGRLSFGQRSGEPIQAEALGFVLLCAGIAIVLHLSPILSAMAMGSMVASIARHHARPFHAIEGIEWPFMILFFILAGASLRVDGAGMVVTIVICYLVARTIGTYLGVFAVGTALGYEKTVSRWMGLALLPQAGVALGMALMASQRLPEYGETILAAVLLATVILEFVSPIITRRVLQRVGAVAQDE